MAASFMIVRMSVLYVACDAGGAAILGESSGSPIVPAVVNIFTPSALHPFPANQLLFAHFVAAVIVAIQIYIAIFLKAVGRHICVGRIDEQLQHREQAVVNM